MDVLIQGKALVQIIFVCYTDLTEQLIIYCCRRLCEKCSWPNRKMKAKLLRECLLGPNNWKERLGLISKRLLSSSHNLGKSVVNRTAKWKLKSDTWFSQVFMSIFNSFWKTVERFSSLKVLGYGRGITWLHGIHGDLFLLKWVLSI